MTLKLIDCFSGIGGFSLAAERIVGGFETIQFVECEPYAQKILKKHWPNVPIHDDIRTYQPEPYSASVVCGGFPCQDISTGGQGQGITKETRSGLFYELMRVIRLVRPRFVVLENVAAILNNGLGIVLGELASARYDCEWCCIPASALGACHERDRFWLVASDSEYFGLSGTKEAKSNEQISKTKTREEITVKSQGSSQSLFGENFSRITRKWESTPSMLNPNWRRYESKCVIRRRDDGVSNRMERIKCLGNSVVPQVAAIPLQRVLDLEKLTVST